MRTVNRCVTTDILGLFAHGSSLVCLCMPVLPSSACPWPYKQVLAISAALAWRFGASTANADSSHDPVPFPVAHKTHTYTSSLAFPWDSAMLQYTLVPGLIMLWPFKLCMTSDSFCLQAMLIKLASKCVGTGVKERSWPFAVASALQVRRMAAPSSIG